MVTSLIVAYFYFWQVSLPLTGFLALFIWWIFIRSSRKKKESSSNVKLPAVYYFNIHDEYDELLRVK